MHSKNSTIRYSRAFKESIVSLNQTRRFSNSLSKKCNVSVSPISKWIRQADPNDINILSLRNRELLKENKRLKRRDRYFKASSDASDKKLIDKGRATALREAIDRTSDCPYRRTFHSDQGWICQQPLYTGTLKKHGIFKKINRTKT